MSRLSAPCSMAVEDTFGPAVASSCVGGFDFTLLFEESILTVLPLGIAIAWALLRFFSLWHESVKVRKSWALALKSLLFVVSIVLQIALLAVWVIHEVPKTSLTIACIIITIIGYLVLFSVSYLEHTRSVRPSTLLSVYFGLSLLLDLARVRTLFFIPESHTVAPLFLAGFFIKLVLLLLEISSKRTLLRPEWRETSPEETSGIFNRALFIWLNSVLIKGFRTLLSVDGLMTLDEQLLSASKPARLIERWERAEKSNKNALLWTFLWHYKWRVLEGVLPRLAYTGFLFAQPFLLQRVLDFVSNRDVEKDETGYGLIGAYAVVYIGIAISYAVYHHRTYRLLTIFRGSLVTLIFSKTLRINSFAISDAEAITLMSADIDRIGLSMPLLHEVYASFIEIALALWLLYRVLGIAIVAPIIWIILCLVAGLPLATLAGDAQVPWLEAIEDRLAVTAKALNAMKAIKMTGLGDLVSAKIRDLRMSEIHASFRYRLLNILVTISYFASSALAPVWAFGVYILLARAHNSETLTEPIAFAALSLFELLNQPLIHIVDGTEHIQTVINSFRRIQEYLTDEEREDHRLLPPKRSSSREIYTQRSTEDEMPLKEDKTSIPMVSLNMATKTAATLEDVSAGYPPNSQNIIKNLNFEISRGKTTMIYGPVGSGKSTILRLLLGEVQASEGSVSTCFSRAAFCPQSPWITWGSIQENILGMSAWGKPWYDTVASACALSTDFKELPLGDQTQTGTRGSRLSGGQQMRVSLARALYSRNPVIILDDVLTGLDRTTERSILDSVFGPSGLLKQSGTTTVMATNSVNHLHYADHIIVIDDQGRLAQQGTLESISAAGKYLQNAGTQLPATTSRPELELSDETLQELGMLDQETLDTSRQAGDLKIYAYYTKIAGWKRILAYLIACTTFSFGFTFPSLWVNLWTAANESHPNENIGYWLGVYGALAALTLIGCAAADFIFNLNIVPTTSRKFHELLLSTTMRAHTSMLTSTDVGQTINRFNQDLELIDNDLPKAADQTVFQFITAIISSVLVFIGSGYAAATIPLILLLLGVIQLYYLRTSRQLRILDIEAKAPLFSQFLETLGGVACIRAFGWTGQYLQRCREVLDRSQKPYYLLWCIQRWLTLVLDLFVAAVAILLVALATSVTNGKTGFLGVALFNIVTFSTTLQTLVTEWTQVETAIGAVSRIRSYVSHIKDENLANENGEVPQDWPSEGAVTFKDVTASYDSALEPVLKQISLSIKPGEKVAVCGRTGSGKSSLISTLLRLLDLESGIIFIDGVDISTIPRQVVRQQINTVSQEPFFLHGTVRENIDPFDTATDERIAEVLHDMGMWELFEARGGLDGDMNDETLSHGQRQLFCLGRAVIRSGRIVVMDEAMSSVDADTEQLMQRIIDSEFRGRTILAIVHKLHTILDFDRVILLDKGTVVETGNPRELLARENSAFQTLYNKMRDAAE